MSLERPFAVYYKNQERELCYIGADHSADIDSKTFKLIQTTIEEFKPDLLILEGFEIKKGFSPAALISYIHKSCVTPSSQEFRCGEPLYAAYLAHNKNIPFIGAELDDEQIFLDLQSQGYEKNDVFGFYFTRQIPQYFNEKQIADANELPQKFDELLKCTSVHGINLTYASYQDWLNQKMGRPVNISELMDTNLVAPIPNGNNLQQISSKINLLRDQHILKVIFDSFSSFKRVLVIYGASHFLTQRDVFVQYFGKEICIHSYNSTQVISSH